MKQNNDVSVQIDKDSIVSFSQKYLLNKVLNVSVFRGLSAITYIGGKPIIKINEGSEQNIYEKCGKEFLGKEVQFAFFSPNNSFEMNYGFGPINVNNERLNEAYRVGVNGKIIFSVIDYVKLINAFNQYNKITIEDVRAKVIPLVKMAGVQVVSGFFSNSKVSVFEIDSKLLSIREEIENSIINEKTLEKLGIKIETITISPIYVNEEDLEMIRNRINFKETN
jgi:membrane protease subunit (stomatin/prohibitin family)